MIRWRPKHCRYEAFDYFCSHLRQIGTYEGLFNCAFAIAKHKFQMAKPEAADRYLDDIVSRVRARMSPGPQDSAVLANLHEVLFEEDGFGGNEDEYYSAANSFMPVVLATRRGVPVTLSLVYAVIASRLGLNVHGLNTPGHFLVQVNLLNDSLIIDPYFGGEPLSASGVRERIYEMAQIQYSPSEPFPLATNRQWLRRILANLIQIYRADSNKEDEQAMLELMKAVSEQST